MSGDTNKASNYASFVAGGNDSEASGNNSFVGGSAGRLAGPGDCATIFGTIFGTC